MSKLIKATVYELGLGGPHVITGSVSPLLGGGVAAPLNSLYIDDVTGLWYQKIAAPDTSWTEAIVGVGNRGYFGSGYDGDVVINGTITLTDDMYYDNLTIGAAGTLITAGFKVYVKDTLTIVAGGVLHNDGNAAIDTAAGTAGSSTRTLRGGLAGGIGGTGNGGASPNNSYYRDPRYPSPSSRGGVGGTSGARTGGAVGTIPYSSVNSSYNWQAINGVLGQALKVSTSTYAVSTGGGGGAGTGVLRGGGGGGGGNVLLLMARNIVNAGEIRVAGGAGAQSSNGNTGGGGGGGGGCLFYGYQNYSGAVPIAPGGLGGLANGGADAPTDGNVGNDGVVVGYLL